MRVLLIDALIDRFHVNVDRYKRFYSVFLALVACCAAAFVSFHALLPVFSLCLLLPLLHYFRTGGVNRNVFALVVFPHCFLVGLLGGRIVVWSILVALCLVAVHAGLWHQQQVQKKKGPDLSEVVVVAETPVGGVNVLEEFRRHSLSVKQKYGL